MPPHKRKLVGGATVEQRLLVPVVLAKCDLIALIVRRDVVVLAKVQRDGAVRGGARRQVHEVVGDVRHLVGEAAMRQLLDDGGHRVGVHLADPAAGRRPGAIDVGGEHHFVGHAIPVADHATEIGGAHVVGRAHVVELGDVRRVEILARGAAEAAHLALGASEPLAAHVVLVRRRRSAELRDAKRRRQQENRVGVDNDQLVVVVQRAPAGRVEEPVLNGVRLVERRIDKALHWRIGIRVADRH